MDEGGGLEGVVGPFLSHVAGGEAVELLIDEGEKLRSGVRIALAGGGEQLGQVVAPLLGSHGAAPRWKNNGRIACTLLT